MNGGTQKNLECFQLQPLFSLTCALTITIPKWCCLRCWDRKRWADVVHCFPIAAVRNFHKCGDFKQYKSILLQLSQVWSQGVARAALLLKALGEKSIPCLFQLLKAILIPWLVAPPQWPSHSHLFSYHLLCLLNPCFQLIRIPVIILAPLG